VDWRADRTAGALALLEHWRNFLFVDYRQLGAHKIWWAPVYLLCSAGHQAVVIFFIMSGYLISGSVFRMLEQGRWSWRTYLYIVGCVCGWFCCRDCCSALYGTGWDCIPGKLR